MSRIDRTYDDNAGQLLTALGVLVALGNTSLNGLQTGQTSGNALLTALGVLIGNGNVSLNALQGLLLAQGAVATASTGPLVMGLVSDTAQPALDGVVSPLSINSEGRLRVASVNVDLDAAWQAILAWPSGDPWQTENLYV